MLQLTFQMKEEEDRYAAALAITQLCEGFEGKCVENASPHRQHIESKSRIVQSGSLTPGSHGLLGLDLSDKKSNSPAGNASTVSSDCCPTSPLDLTVKKRNDTNFQTSQTSEFGLQFTLIIIINEPEILMLSVCDYYTKVI